ncbi:MAG: cell wall-binding repeat-containing protein [Coriobacteriia bacterium]|nr:cell wall-binding repeat-containing protein [Coriobacteriia bacterium]
MNKKRLLIAVMLIAIVACFFGAVSTAHAFDLSGIQAMLEDGTVPEHGITATAGSGGSISPDGITQVAEGQSIIYTMQPDAGYQVDTITVDGVLVPPRTQVTGVAVPTLTGYGPWYTFINVDKPHTIDVTFKPTPDGWYTITPYPGANGQIWMKNQTVRALTTLPGVAVPVSIIPDAGYYVSKLEVDGKPVPPSSWYVFYDIRCGHTIAAEFARDTGAAERAAGSNRYETAIEISKANFDRADAVVLATGLNYADALSASGLAGAYDAPLLLTAQGSLSDGVVAEIRRLSASEVIIIGGTAAVSDGVEAALKALPGVSVERISGSDRYATAAAVASKAKGIIGEDFSKKAFLARGDDFADGLSVAPLAYANGIPVLLTRSTDLSAPAASSITGLGITDVTIIGGTNVVSSAVENSVRNLATTRRVAGNNRFETAERVARYGIEQGLADTGFIGVATGLNFPDALAGGAATGKRGGVLLLTSSNALSPNWEGFLASEADEYTDVQVFGGYTAISSACRDKISVLLYGE